MALDRYIEEAWLREVLTQKGCFISAVEGLNESLNDAGAGNSRAFSHIQAMLNHAGLISKILWGEGRDPDPKGNHFAVRCAIGIDDREWLLKSRTLRNALEHYHERILSWGARAIVVDLNVGSKDMIKIEGVDAEVLFDRHLDPATMTFSIRNDSISLQVLTDEVQEIATLASNRLAQIEVTRYGE